MFGDVGQRLLGDAVHRKTGLLMDTLVVRALVAPSIVALLGRWFWWPRDLPRSAVVRVKTRELELV